MTASSMMFVLGALAGSAAGQGYGSSHNTNYNNNNQWVTSSHGGWGDQYAGPECNWATNDVYGGKCVTKCPSHAQRKPDGNCACGYGYNADKYNRNKFTPGNYNWQCAGASPGWDYNAQALPTIPVCSSMQELVAGFCVPKCHATQHRDNSGKCSCNYGWGWDSYRINGTDRVHVSLSGSLKRLADQEFLSMDGDEVEPDARHSKSKHYTGGKTGYAGYTSYEAQPVQWGCVQNHNGWNHGSGSASPGQTQTALQTNYIWKTNYLGGGGNCQHGKEYMKASGRCMAKCPSNGYRKTKSPYKCSCRTSYKRFRIAKDALASMRHTEFTLGWGCDVPVVTTPTVLASNTIIASAGAYYPHYVPGNLWGASPYWQGQGYVGMGDTRYLSNECQGHHSTHKHCYIRYGAPGWLGPQNSVNYYPHYVPSNLWGGASPYWLGQGYVGLSDNRYYGNECQGHNSKHKHCHIKYGSPGWVNPHVSNCGSGSGKHWHHHAGHCMDSCPNNGYRGFASPFTCACNSGYNSYRLEGETDITEANAPANRHNDNSYGWGCQ